MRLFVAADLPESLRRRLGEIQEALRALPFRVNWVHPEGIHLTLAFLGEQPEARRAAAEAALPAAARDARPFRLQAAGLGAFPEHGAPRVLWVGLEGDLGALEGLRRAVAACLGAAGFRSEDRPFRPHLTLGRVREAPRGDWRGGLDAAGPATAGGFDVAEVILFESRLGPGGASYRALSRFPLGGAGAA